MLPGRIVLYLRETVLNMNAWDVTTVDLMVDGAQAMHSSGGRKLRWCAVNVSACAFPAVNGH